MERPFVRIPKGATEFVDGKQNCFKVLRKCLDNEPKLNVITTFFMEGVGFAYTGEIYHKTTTYAYIYLY